MPTAKSHFAPGDQVEVVNDAAKNAGKQGTVETVEETPVGEENLITTEFDAAPATVYLESDLEHVADVTGDDPVLEFHSYMGPDLSAGDPYQPVTDFIGRWGQAILRRGVFGVRVKGDSFVALEMGDRIERRASGLYLVSHDRPQSSYELALGKVASE